MNMIQKMNETRKLEETNIALFDSVKFLELNFMYGIDNVSLCNL